MSSPDLQGPYGEGPIQPSGVYHGHSWTYANECVREAIQRRPDKLSRRLAEIDTLLRRGEYLGFANGWQLAPEQKQAGTHVREHSLPYHDFTAMCAMRNIPVPDIHDAFYWRIVRLIPTYERVFGSVSAATLVQESAEDASGREEPEIVFSEAFFNELVGGLYKYDTHAGGPQAIRGHSNATIGIIDLSVSIDSNIGPEQIFEELNVYQPPTPPMFTGFSPYGT